MGHVWLGLDQGHLQKLLSQSGFSDVRIVTLPVDPDAKGPALFVASAKHNT
jgi:hypothetical protein